MYTKNDSEVIPIKAPFETVVSEHTAWLYQLVRNRVGNRETAEDMVQEIWIRAFRAYDSYYDDGRIRHWLARIALNHIRNVTTRSPGVPFLSLDVSADDENDPLYTYLSDGASPENDYLRQELVNEVLAAVAKLPEAQRQVVTYRYINGLSLEETAAVMQIPKGTVKSKAHYAIDEIRKMLGLNDHETRTGKTKKRKGVSTMECKEMYKYLFMYAMGKLSDENKAAVAEHLKECKVCADIVTALEKLIPTMVFAEEREMCHYNIHFPQYNLVYLGYRMHFDDYIERNRQLEEWNGIIPDDQVWLEHGCGKICTPIGTFDNDGNEIGFVMYDQNENNYRYKATYIKKIYPDMWGYESLLLTELLPSYFGLDKEKDCYHGADNNYLGCSAKSALYQAIPANAKNIKIKHGNGVIDCGTFKFAYVDRYITEDELLTLDFTYTLD